MKQVNPSELQATDYRVLSESPQEVPRRYAGDRGLVSAFCGLLWLLLVVGSVGYLGAWGVHLLQQGGISDAR